MRKLEDAEIGWHTKGSLFLTTGTKIRESTLKGLNMNSPRFQPGESKWTEFTVRESILKTDEKIISDGGNKHKLSGQCRKY
jgi:hypothetical protein